MSDEHLIASPPKGWRADGIYDGQQFQTMTYPRVVNTIFGRYRVTKYHELHLIVRAFCGGTFDTVSNFLIH